MITLKIISLNDFIKQGILSFSNSMQTINYFEVINNINKKAFYTRTIGCVRQANFATIWFF